MDVARRISAGRHAAGLGAAWLLQRFIVRQGRTVLQGAVSLAHSIQLALGRKPYLRRLARRHPGGFRFLASRVNRCHFHGLPLTVLVLALAYVLALFAGLVEDAVTCEPIVALEVVKDG